MAFLVLLIIALLAIPVLLGFGIALLCSPRLRSGTSDVLSRAAPWAIVLLGLGWLLGQSRTVEVRMTPATDVAAVDHAASPGVDAVVQPLTPPAAVHSRIASEEDVPALWLLVLLALLAIPFVWMLVRGGRLLGDRWAPVLNVAALVCVAAIVAERVHSGRAAVIHGEMQPRAVEQQESKSLRRALVEQRRLDLERRVQAGATPLDQTASSLGTESGNAGESAVPVRITAFEGGSSVGVVVNELPGWVHAGETIDRTKQVERFVLTSGRFAEIAEGEQQLLRQLEPRLMAYLQQSGDPPLPTAITAAELQRAGVVTHRVDEEFQVEVGEFSPSVYRVTWEVTLRPEVRRSLATPLLAAQRDERLWRLGLGFGGMTVLLGMCALGLRRDVAGRGPRRAGAGAAAVALVVITAGLCLCCA